MADEISWSDGQQPVAGFINRAVLDAEGIAEMAEFQALFLKRIEQLRAEGEDTPETRLHWRSVLQPDFSGMSDEQRETIEAQIEEKRADPEFRAQLRRRLEGKYPELAPLMDEEYDGEPPSI